MMMGSIAMITSVSVLHDKIDERRSAKIVRDFPGLRLIDPHQRRVKDKSRFHAKVERSLQGLIPNPWNRDSFEISKSVRL